MAKKRQEEKQPAPEHDNTAEEPILSGGGDDSGEQGADLEPTIELLSFTVGDEEHAFYVAEVREINKFQQITTVPRCPEYILGIISLRGEVIPIIDLKKRLALGGGKPQTDEPLFIIVKFGEESVGFMVESIAGIIRIKEEDLEDTPGVVPPDKAEYFRGVVRYQDRLITILHTERLLAIAEDFQALDQQWRAAQRRS